MDSFRENLIKKIGRANLEKIETAKIGIAGAGGLGSNCALNLVRVGFKNLTIADFDKVEPANLDRQFYFSDQLGMNKVEALKKNLKRINPELNLKIINKKIEAGNIKEIFGGCDCVAECLDRADSKKMLVEGLLKMKKFTITASGLGGIGSSDDIKVHRIKEDLIMIGDMHSDICRKPALSPRVNIAAAKQADVILEHTINNIF